MANYSDHIKEILMEHGIREQELEKIAPDDVFRKVLEWAGLQGYDGSIKRWIKDIYGIEIGK